jgi:hypothetical protein
LLKILNQTILIPWTKLDPGMSVFVPCLDRKQHIDTLLQEANRVGYKVVCKQVIEKGKYGLRLWRIE